MKKIFAIIGTFILICFMASCGNDVPESSTTAPLPDTSTTVEKVITGIEIEGVTSTILQNETYNHSGVKVYARFEDNTREDVTSAATFSSIDTQTVGKKTVNVTYKTFQKSYEVTVVAVILERIECSTSNIELNYEVGSVVDFSKLKVTAVYSNNTKNEVTGYTITLKNSAGTVLSIQNPLNDVGNYSVTISYENKTYSFAIHVYSSTTTYNEVLKMDDILNSYSLTNGRYTFSTKQTIFNEDYAKLEISGNGSILENVDENSEAISQQYGSNTFTSRLKITEGTSEFKLTLTEDADLIMYVGGKTGRSLSITSGETQILPLGNISQSVSVLTVSLSKGEYLINSTYADLYLYMMQFNYEGEAPAPVTIDLSASIVFNSASSVTIDLGLENTITYDYHISVTAQGYEQAITESLTTLTELTNNTSYKLTGYITYTKNNISYIANLEESNFTTSVYEELESFTEDLCAIEEYSNGITVETGAFVTNAPTGYVLDSLAVFHNDQLVEEVFYDSQEVISFFDLEADEEYRVDAFYRAEDREVQSLKHNAKLEVTPGYRIHFVGFYVVCYGSSNNLVSLKMTYDNEVLYTYYIGKGDAVPYYVYNIMLPIKYEHLTIAGSLDYTDKIDADASWEIILLDLSAKDQATYTVIFYETNSIKHIASVQEVTAGQAAIAPTKIPETYYSVDQKYRYDFAGYNKEFDAVESNMLIMPTYKETILVTIDVDYDLGLYVAPNHITSYCVAADTNNSSATIVYFIEGGEYTSKTEVKDGYFETTPSTSYTITMEYTYRDQNKESVTKSKTTTITTPSTNQSDTGDIISVEALNAVTIEAKFTQNVYCVEYIGSNEVVSNDHLRFNNEKEADEISYTMQNVLRNATYDIYYYLHDSSNTMIYYSYYYGTVKTPDVKMPVVTKVLVSPDYSCFTIYAEFDSCLEVVLNARYFVPELMDHFNMFDSYWLNHFSFNGGFESFGKNLTVEDPITGEEHTYQSFGIQISINFIYDREYHEYFFYPTDKTEKVNGYDFYVYEYIV